MKNLQFTVFGLILAALAAATAGADSLVVSQVDNSSLLAGQFIKVYVSATNKNGVSIPGLQKQQFKVFEGPEGKPPVEREIIDFRSGANINEGVSILFLIDNSDSMYDDAGGARTKNDAARRITYAKRAIEDLLPSIKNPADRLALTSFNVKTGTDISLTDDRAAIKKALSEIQRPKDLDRYTELYESLYYSVTKLGDIRGRKVIILLSDGENFPYQPKKASDPPHPQFSERKAGKTGEGAIELAQREGISIFTIGIGDGAFQNTLKKISAETGGVSYQVQDLSQLKKLYGDIQERVLNEYMMTYYAGMEPADRKNVKVVLNRNNESISGNRSYYSATIFGRPQEPLPIWIFAFLLLALALLFLLWKLKFENKKAAASLEVLSVNGKKSRIQPMTIMEEKNEVTISGDSDADLTITGDAKLAGSEVKLFKEGSDYTLMSGQGTVKVNNQPVKAKKLRSGDLITVGSTTIVFDGGFTRKDPTHLLEKTRTSRLKSKTRTDVKGRSTKTPHN